MLSRKQVEDRVASAANRLFPYWVDSRFVKLLIDEFTKLEWEFGVAEDGGNIWVAGCYEITVNENGTFKLIDTRDEHSSANFGQLDKAQAYAQRMARE